MQKAEHRLFLADSDYWYFVCPDADCLSDYDDAGVKADNVIQNGEIIFRCEMIPTTDLTVNILRLEVETSE